MKLQNAANPHLPSGFIKHCVLENLPFIADCPIRTSIDSVIYIAMFDETSGYQHLSHDIVLHFSNGRPDYEHDHVNLTYPNEFRIYNNNTGLTRYDIRVPSGNLSHSC